LIDIAGPSGEAAVSIFVIRFGGVDRAHDIHTDEPALLNRFKSSPFSGKEPPLCTRNGWDSLCRISEDFFKDRLELHRIDREARTHNDSLFEKLAILDGGTVALVVTAVLGRFVEICLTDTSSELGLRSLFSP
jgi:hypothetical protein